MTNVNSADKKPEKYVKPSGKVGIRMVPVDKEVVKNEDASKEAQHHAQGMKDARADMKAAKSNDAMTKAMNKLQHHTKAHKKATAAMKEAYDEPQGQAKRMMSPLQKARMDKEKADRDRDGKLKPGVVKRGKSTMNRLKDIRQRADAFAAKSRKEEVEQVDELNKSTLANYVKKASDDRAKNAYDVGKSGEINYKGLKRRQGINRAVNKLAKEEAIDEVLDRPGALASYKKKAKMQSDKARNSATAKIVRGNSDISKEKETIRKREKGQDMADRTGARQFRKSIGRPYIKKEEVEQLDELSPRTKASYLKKASAQNKKVQKAYDKSVKSSPDAYFGDDSPEDQKRAKTMDKRQKGMAMAKGRKYGQKYESVEEKKALTMKQMRRALQSIKPSKKKPTLPKAPWDKKDD